ncbi:PaaI family thioesterase [Tomitella cavernea]
MTRATGADDAVRDDGDTPRGGFPVFSAAPEDGGPHFGRFVAAMRDLQDLAVSAAPEPEVFGAAADKAEELAAMLRPYAAEEGKSPTNRSVGLPGRGSLLMLPWTLTGLEPGRVTASGVFRRYHLGGNGAAHGGVLPLLFDDVFGMVTHAQGQPVSRTAYLTVNYRNVTPLDKELTVEATVDSADGRKTYVSGRLWDGGTLLADADALMVRLRPWQP